MGEKSYPITVEQFQEGIELLCPCMDDYLYLYDFKKDYYYISSHADTQNESFRKYLAYGI